MANLLLTTQLLRSYATFYDYNIDLNGEFSPNGRGGTPFGPFPMQWPRSVGSSMIEILISDFTINSLLYWMHKYFLQYFQFLMMHKYLQLNCLYYRKLQFFIEKENITKIFH